MPRGNGLGPVGYGPITGRGGGFCAGYVEPGYLNPMVGSFRVRGCGVGLYSRGRGLRHRFYATGLPLSAKEANPFEFAPDYNEKYSPESEAKALSREAKFLKKELKAIEDRMDQLKRAEKENPADEKQD